MKKQVLRFTTLLLACALFFSGCSKTPDGEAGTRSETATAQGFGGEVSVTLTTQNGTLAEVVIQGDKETEAVGGQAIQTLQKAMKDSQSIDVEAVSGATLTSEAVLSAARQAWNTLNGVETAKPDVKMKAGTYTVREMMQPIFINGECVYTSPSVKEIAAYCRQEKDTLWDESKRLFNPHQMYIDLSPRLYEVKKQLLDRMSADD